MQCPGFPIKYKEYWMKTIKKRSSGLHLLEHLFGNMQVVSKERNNMINMHGPRKPFPVFLVQTYVLSGKNVEFPPVENIFSEFFEKLKVSDFLRKSEKF